MASEDLLSKIKGAVSRSGYPLEQRAGHLLQAKGWTPFYSVYYADPETCTERELDILAYKLVRERRIELRISCKRNKSKPWILFTEDATRYYKHGNALKTTPVTSDMERYSRIHQALRHLSFFSHPRIAINFSAFSGKEFNQ